MRSIKIIEVKYERLVSDPHGFNNTRIGMVATVDEKDDPITILNGLKSVVDDRLSSYEQLKTLQRKYSYLTNQIEQNQSHVKTLSAKDSLGEYDLQKLNKLIESTIKLKKDIEELEKEIDILQV